MTSIWPNMKVTRIEHRHALHARCIFPAGRVEMGLFLHLKRRKKKTLYVGNSNDNTLCAGKNSKAIKTVELVLSVCFVTWMPFLILNVVSCYNLTTECRRGDSKRPIPVARTWVKATALTLSAVNPLIYCFWNGDFQQVFSLVFLLAARSPPDLQQI